MLDTLVLLMLFPASFFFAGALVAHSVHVHVCSTRAHVVRVPRVHVYLKVHVLRVHVVHVRVVEL